ncbi:MAG: tetratricopeptide repeat protein, partial [Desulfobulbales bacterium]|nr:tetratricopeptide repeat protein [Desulfobulbales bacterium]
ISYAKTGNFPDAVRSMQTAIALSPDDAMKHSTLGIIYHAENKLPMALEQYSRSVSLNPGFAEMYYNMAMTYHEMGKPLSAYKAARQAQRLGFPGSSTLVLKLKKNIAADIADISPDDKMTLHLRHIITPDAEEAEFVLGKLREGEDFTVLAAKYSLEPFNINGGYIGPFAVHELMREIAEVVVPLTPFAFSPVITTSSGHHIFQKFSVDADLLSSD